MYLPVHNEKCNQSIVFIFFYFSGAEYYGNAYFGAGSGVIWLQDVDCYGYESQLEDCNHDGWGHTHCHHHEDVGVKCNSP